MHKVGSFRLDEKPLRVILLVYSAPKPKWLRIFSCPSTTDECWYKDTDKVTLPFQCLEFSVLKNLIGNDSLFLILLCGTRVKWTMSFSVQIKVAAFEHLA